MSLIPGVRLSWSRSSERGVRRYGMPICVEVNHPAFDGHGEPHLQVREKPLKHAIQVIGLVVSVYKELVPDDVRLEARALFFATCVIIDNRH